MGITSNQLWQAEDDLVEILEEIRDLKSRLDSEDDYIMDKTADRIAELESDLKTTEAFINKAYAGCP